MKQSEALDMITKLRLAQQAMESACKRIDELKEENKNLKEALAKQEQDEKFCDANCVWTDHHPDCKLAQQEQCDCKDPSQCWEPCGQLGKSEKHAKVYEQEQRSVSEQLGEPVACLHRLVDVTNPVVKSGYMCMDCGAVFRAYVESKPKQEQGEPVAYRSRMRNRDGQVITGWVVHLETTENPDPRVEIEPLYTTPQLAQKPWVGLTDEEYLEAESVVWVTINLDSDEKEANREFYKAIEAKLKEKNDC